MKQIGLIVAIFCGILLSIPVHAAEKKGCSLAMLAEAKKNVVPVPVKDWTWKKLYDSFSEFGLCAQPRTGGLYDLDVASAYSDGIKNLLINNWNGVGDLVSYGDKNSAFRDFVLSFISDSYQQEELNTIEANAHSHCPSGAKKYCDALESKVKQVEKDIAELNAQ